MKEILMPFYKVAQKHRRRKETRKEILADARATRCADNDGGIAPINNPPVTDQTLNAARVIIARRQLGKGNFQGGID